MMQQAFRRFAPRVTATATAAAFLTTKAFASDATTTQQQAPAVCPIDHKTFAAQQASVAATTTTQPGVCPIDHKALAAMKATEGVCPINHTKVEPEKPEALKIFEQQQQQEATQGVCPVNHGQMKPEGVCPVNHEAMKKEGVCPVNHEAMKPEGVCPVNHEAMKKEGVCPVNHEAMKKEGVCPVNHEAMKKEGVCPVNHGKSSIPLAEGAIDKDAPAGVCPISKQSAQDSSMGSHMGGLQNFVGKKYIGAPKEPSNDSGDRVVTDDGSSFFQDDFHGGYDPAKIQYADFVPGGLIPAAGRGNSADGAHWVNPSPMQLFRAIRRKEMDLKEEDALAVAFTHADVVDFTWQLIQEYEQKYSDKCPNVALKRFEGKYGQHTPKSWLTETLYGIQPYDRHDWWIDRCGTEVRYIIDYYSNDEDEYWMDVRPDLNRPQNVVDRITFAYDKYKQGEKWF